MGQLKGEGNKVNIISLFYQVFVSQPPLKESIFGVFSDNVELEFYRTFQAGL